MGSGGMIGVIAIYLFITIQQMGATKCKSTPVFTGSPTKTASPINVTLSSLLENYRAEYCMDGDINTFCHTKDEENPFLLLEYAKQIKVNEVTVTVRKKHGFARAKEMIVIITNIKPTTGQIATTLGTQLGATFKGPATKGGQVISFKSSTGAMGKYVVVQQLYKGIMNLAEIQINPPVVSMSSQLGVTLYPAENCVDGDVDTFCHTETEENPYFMVEMTEPIEVTDVKVTVRKNCCWERVKEMVVIVTNTAPTRGQLASGLQLGETFIGPATYSAQVITFKSKTAITGKYVIVQQKYKGYMNLAEVQVNNDHDTTLYMKKWKNSYTNCIQNPECGGCIDIVQKRLPGLLQENIIKEGEIGVNNGLMEIGSLHGSTKRDIESRAQTLTLRKVGDIKTIRTDNEMVIINGTVNGIVGGKRNYAGTRRRLTGLYAAPGDLVTITFPEELIGKVTIDINTAQNGFKLSFSVKTSLCKIGSPWGGLINFNMKSKDSYKGTFKVNFTNAIKAPTFIYNVTTNEQWNKIRNYSPKWAALIVPGQVEIVVQTLKIKDITDMEEAISRIKLTMDALEDMLGLPAGSRPGAETLDFDPVGGGWGGHGGGCSGGFNTVGDHLYTEDKVTDYKYYDDFFKEFGTNRIVLHEFGHGYCYNDLPSEGDHWYVETVSQYIRYIRGASFSTLDPEMTSKDLDWDLLYRMVGFSMNSKGKPCGEFFNKPEENAWYYTCWKWIHFIPSRIHGWHVFKDVHTLNAMSTKNYNSKTDRLVDLYCQATKHNMLPMFNFYNIKPSEEAITKNCKKLPESELLTKWLNIVECVKQSMSHVNKDIRDCAKMPRFPHHKGLCLISGVCHSDDTNNGKQTTMIEKFDLYGSTGSKEFMSKKKSSENKKNCLNRAEDFFRDCNNEKDQPITAFFYEKEQGYELDKFNFTFPQPDICEENLCSSREGCPLAKNTLLAFLPKLQMEFSVSFEFRATAWQSGWQNVIHFTEGGSCCSVGDRVPGFWVKDSGRLHPCFAVGDNGNYCTLTTKEYTLNTWHSVEFSQTLMADGKFMYRVVVDGEDIFAPIENTKPRTFSNVKVYAGDNWHNPLEGSIRNLRVNKGCGDICEENRCSSTEGCPLAKNTLLAFLPEMKMEFSVSFEFRATAFASGWNPQSVIHFTEGGDCCNAGQRVPALWVSNSGRLYPCFAIGDNGNYCTFVATKAYTLNTWHSVKFSQTLKNGKYMFRVVVDGEDIFAPIENTKPRIFSNVKVYAGDNWYNPLEGSIRNLLVNTGCGAV